MKALTISQPCASLIASGHSPGIDITAVTKLKHADLWEAAKRLGSQAALARRLGVSQSELGEWINLKRVPPASAVPGSARWTEDYLRDLEAELIALTGKSWEELFPPGLRNSAEFLDCKKTIEQTARLQAEALESYAIATAERLSRSSARIDFDGLQASVANVLETLSYREREVIRLRYGLDDGHRFTIDEVAHIFKVTRERVRQIEAKAIRKLQQPKRAAELVGYLDAIDF